MPIEKAITAVNSINHELGYIDFTEGNCLNFAVALHEILNINEVESKIVVIKRYIPESEESIFSHAVCLPIDGKNQFKWENAFDSHGDNAIENWTNKVQINADIVGYSTSFSIKTYDLNVNELCDMVERKYGDCTLNLLVNNPSLQKEIIRAGLKFSREYL